MVFSFAPLGIIAVSSIVTLLVEALNWLLVYRTSIYQRATGEILRANKKLEETKQQASDKKGGKKLKVYEQSIALSTRDLYFVRMRTSLVAGLIFLATYRLVHLKYHGTVVAKLPFEPPGPLQRLTHMGLSVQDQTACAAAFIYVLCAVGLRANIVKALGLGPSRELQRLIGWDYFTQRGLQELAKKS